MCEVELPEVELTTNLCLTKVPMLMGDIWVEHPCELSADDAGELITQAIGRENYCPRVIVGDEYAACRVTTIITYRIRKLKTKE